MPPFYITPTTDITFKNLKDLCKEMETKLPFFKSIELEIMDDKHFIKFLTHNTERGKDYLAFRISQFQYPKTQLNWTYNGFKKDLNHKSSNEDDDIIIKMNCYVYCTRINNGLNIYTYEHGDILCFSDEQIKIIKPIFKKYNFVVSQSTTTWKNLVVYSSFIDNVLR